VARIGLLSAVISDHQAVIFGEKLLSEFWGILAQGI
jgi:hypothetical protein